MTAEEVNLGLCHVPELFRNPTNMQMELEIYPSPDTITQPIVKDRYKMYAISNVLDNSFESKDVRTEILKRLLGFPCDSRGPSNIDNLDPISEMAQRRLETLNDHQKQFAEAFLLGKDFTLFSQAPAGTGKTHVMAICVCELLNQKFGIILITAPSNLATQSIAKRMPKLTQHVPQGNILFLQAPSTEKTYERSKEDLWTEYHLPETLQYFQTKGRPQALPKFASRYIEKRLPHDGKTYQESQTCQLLLSIHEPKVILGTMQLVLTFIHQWNENYDPTDLKYLHAFQNATCYERAKNRFVGQSEDPFGPGQLYGRPNRKEIRDFSPRIK